MTKATSRSDKTSLHDESRSVGQFGRARDGLREWRLQRLTAIAVIPLSLHFAASVLSLATSDRKTAADWLSCISLGRNPRRSCGDHACADRRWLGRSRLCSHAHPLLVAELLSSIIRPCKSSVVRRGRPYQGV